MTLAIDTKTSFTPPAAKTPSSPQPSAQPAASHATFEMTTPRPVLVDRHAQALRCPAPSSKATGPKVGHEEAPEGFCCATLVGIPVALATTIAMAPLGLLGTLLGSGCTSNADCCGFVIHIKYPSWWACCCD